MNPTGDHGEGPVEPESSLCGRDGLLHSDPQRSTQVMSDLYRSVGGPIWVTEGEIGKLVPQPTGSSFFLTQQICRK